ncbi:hypothetical protein HK096_005571, partial [Nowakowskiella sp. JEL0078]
MIDVEVTISSLGSSNNILGSAGPSSYFPGNLDGDESQDMYLFPQALVKQMSTSVSALSFGKFDISAYFYNDRSWYFPEFNRTIQSIEYDFELVACHELIHGLGLLSRWNSINDFFQSTVVNGGGLIPPLSSQNQSGSTLFTTWQPLSIFDRFIYLQNGTSAISLASSITSVNLNQSTTTKAIQDFQKNSNAVAASITMLKAATTINGLVFMTQNTSIQKVTLATPNLFLKGSSLHHLDDNTFNGTLDFLMTTTVQFQGVSMSQIINAKFLDLTKSGGSQNSSLDTIAPFGINVRAIMSTLGWSTPNNPTPRNLVLQTETSTLNPTPLGNLQNNPTVLPIKLPNTATSRSPS